MGIFFGDVAGREVSAMVNVFINQNVQFKVEYEAGVTGYSPTVLMHLYHTNKMSFP